MKPAVVHPQAEAEADKAFEWYWARSHTAALGFDTELRNAFSFLRKSPHLCAPYLSPVAQPRADLLRGNLLSISLPLPLVLTSLSFLGVWTLKKVQLRTI